MSEGDADQRAGRPERSRAERGGTADLAGAERQADAALREKAGAEAPSLMEEVLRRENLVEAYRRVVRNGGAPGVDGVTVHDLEGYCREHWPRVREELLGGTYCPQPVRRVEIPKPGGGVRVLGIPTVLDRMIQQALSQALTPIFDPTFSADSYGFRPGRSAHQAVRRARDHVAAGHRWVVDLDLERFFDRVNHDVLMARVARRVEDRRVLRLIRRFLQAGTMEDGLVSPRTEGTPQGGPLSPLLSNILLDEWDKELERRGHRFVRYADDCNVYVRSRRAGERVKRSLETFLRKRLRLRINEEKSAVDRPWKRSFLGYSMTPDREPRLKVAPTSEARLTESLRHIFRKGRGWSLVRVVEEIRPKLKGWIAYFRLAEVRASFERLGRWIRRRLRLILWRQWKRPRTRLRELCNRGLDRDRAAISAYNGHGPWWNAGASHMNQAVPSRWLYQLGLVDVVQEWQRLQNNS